MVYYVNDMNALSGALKGADDSAEIVITKSFSMTSGVTIENKTVTISSTGSGSGSGERYTLTRAPSNTDKLFNVKPSGTLILNDITIDGNKSVTKTISGTLIFNAGVVELRDGTTLQNNYGGEIYAGNTAFRKGAGVFNTGGGAKLSMLSGAVIRGNHATISGGGVYNERGASFHMSGGVIGGTDESDANFTYIEQKGIAYSGGGVTNDGGSHVKTSFLMSGNAAVTGNRSNSGCGVSNDGEDAYFSMSGNARVNLNAPHSKAWLSVSGGGIDNQYGKFEMFGGEITGNTADDGAGIFNYGYGVINIKGGSITNNIAKNNGGGVYFAVGSGEVNITDGTVSGNIATSGDGGGVFVAYDILSKLKVGQNVTFANNRAVAAYERDPQDDALYEANIHCTRWTTPLTQGYNNYDIGYTNGDMADLDDYSESNIIFNDICFTQPGVYRYTIRETSQPGDGWTPDGRTYPVIITITDDGQGSLKVTVDYPEGFPEFVNKYEAKAVCITLNAVKIAIGAPMFPGQFTFGVFDEDGNEVASGFNQ
ncbi:MAG: hypothetical protein FWG45_07200 [Oscillospiraceae bacterium]|nr:hypothetical protein [Oscillospiraceae bacterium]